MPKHRTPDSPDNGAKVRQYHSYVTADSATKQRWLSVWNALSHAEKNAVLENGGELSGLIAALRSAGLSAEDIGNHSGGGKCYDAAPAVLTVAQIKARFGVTW